MRLLMAAAIALAAVRQAPARANRAIDLLIDDASVAPAEFAADALIRIATSGQVADRGRRAALLEEAFLRAYVAQLPYRRITAGAPPDSRQGAEVRAGETGLTRVSLQLRAVQALAPCAPERARELFGWIDLDLVPGSCGNALVPSVDEYYATLATLAKSTFAANGGGRAAALQFFELYLWRAQLPTEMPAVIRAMQRFQANRDDAAYFESILRMLLDSGARDPRSFSVASLDVVSRGFELEDGHRQLALNAWFVTRVLRQYLVAQLTGPRCADSATDAVMIDAFNRGVVRREADKDGIDPLANADTRPSRTLAGARSDPYWQTMEAKRLYSDALQLRGADRNPIPMERRRRQEWLDRAERLLFDLDAWSGSREPAERDYFYQKGIIFTLLVDLTPPGAVRTRVLRSFGEFLRRTDGDHVGRALWFAFANRLIERTKSEDRPLVLPLLEQSANPILSLYGRMERVLSGDRVIE